MPGSHSRMLSVKYFVSVLFPLPGLPRISKRREVSHFDHSLYFACVQSHSNVPWWAFNIFLKRVLSKRRLAKHSVYIVSLIAAREYGQTRPLLSLSYSMDWSLST